MLDVTIFTLHRTFPHSCLYLHQLLCDLGTPLSLHIFQLLLIAYSGVALHSTAQQCTVCLLMHSMHSTLTYMQPSCTVYLLVWAIATRGINESLHYYFCFNVHRENKIYRGCSQHWVLRWWCSGYTRRLIVNIQPLLKLVVWWWCTFSLIVNIC